MRSSRWCEAASLPRSASPPRPAPPRLQRDTGPDTRGGRRLVHLRGTTLASYLPELLTPGVGSQAGLPPRHCRPSFRSSSPGPTPARRRRWPAWLPPAPAPAPPTSPGAGGSPAATPSGCRTSSSQTCGPSRTRAWSGTASCWARAARWRGMPTSTPSSLRPCHFQPSPSTTSSYSCRRAPGAVVEGLLQGFPCLAPSQSARLFTGTRPPPLQASYSNDFPEDPVRFVPSTTALELFQPRTGIVLPGGCCTATTRGTWRLRCQSGPHGARCQGQASTHPLPLLSPQAGPCTACRSCRSTTPAAPS